MSSAVRDLEFLLAPLSSEDIAFAYNNLPPHLDRSTLSAVSIDLQEPEKHVVAKLMDNQHVDPHHLTRKAVLILLDHKNEKCIEVVVDLEQKVSPIAKELDGQPAFSLGEYQLVEDIIRKDPGMKELLQKKGIDINKVVVDLWSPGAGYVGDHESDSVPTSRLAKPLLFYQENPGDNIYARPIPGLSPVVDLYKKCMRRIDIFGDIYIPSASADYYEDKAPAYKLKPLSISQPQGPSFEVDGHLVKWANWEFRVGFNTREGVLLRTVSYFDPLTNKKRPILYRASLAEMVVPYGDPAEACYRKNAFDLGEEGIGRNLNSLELGCDCVGEIHYFDASFCDPEGKAVTVKNAICMHEEDAGLLYKHTDWRDQFSYRARSRRLVLSCFSTIANYDYGFVWNFYLDGRIEYEVKMTGTVSTEAFGAHAEKGQHYKYGTTLGKDLYAPIHQHFFSMRLDFMIDGIQNRLYEVNTHTTAETDVANVQSNAFSATQTLLARESEAKRDICATTGRFWKISNGTITNSLGYHPSYALIPETNTFLMVGKKASVAKRASHLRHHLWCSPFAAEEFYPGGRFPNMRATEDGISEWSKQDRSLVDQELVVWYNFGTLHIVRPEEWPIMPIATAKFTLLPFGFFNKNPSMLKQTKSKL